MSGRKKTMRTNTIMILVTLLMVLLVSVTGNAEEKHFNSQGKIIFDNRTEDPADDVVFDAADFNKLANVCR